MEIDIDFDFTEDARGKDPDIASPMLQTHHQQLWNRAFPNGEVMELKTGESPYYLLWKDFVFVSDAIIVLMRHGRNQKIIEQAYMVRNDYNAYYDKLYHRSYTIGGMIIFPRHRNSMNQMRGMKNICSIGISGGRTYDGSD